MKTLKNQTKLAGILYILIVLLGPFVIMYIPSQIIVDGDISQTALNLLDNQVLFKIGILGEVIIIMIEVLLVTLLYTIFKRVNKPLSLAAAFSRFGMVIIMGVNVLVLASIIPLMDNALYATAYTNAQIDTLIYYLFNIHEFGVLVWGVFFALHLLCLGLLVVKSEFVPSLLGKFIMVGSIGYFLESTKGFLEINSDLYGWLVNFLLLFSMIGEIGLFIYFIINKRTKEYNYES